MECGGGGEEVEEETIRLIQMMLDIVKLFVKLITKQKCQNDYLTLLVIVLIVSFTFSFPQSTFSPTRK